jgi:methyl-accepting chemotaxis protein
MSQSLVSTSEFADILTGDVRGLAKAIPEFQSGGEGIVAVMAARLADHAKFLRNAVEIAGSGVSVSGSHECAFGKWYDSNRDAYSAPPEFAALNGPHELVHRAAQRLSLDRCEQGAAELVRASESLLGHFIDLAYALAPAGA